MRIKLVSANDILTKSAIDDNGCKIGGVYTVENKSKYQDRHLYELNNGMCVDSIDCEEVREPRKLLGYRLKEEFSNYEKAAAEIAYEDLNRQVGLSKNGSKNINFNPGCVVHDRLEAAGVMHWFEEVYEQEKLEVGKWYKRNNSIGIGYELVFITGKDRNYGFGSVGYWSDVLNTEIDIDIDNYLKANPKEVEEALIKEAKKRGFKEGVETKPIDDTGIGFYDSTKISGLFSYDSEDNSLDVDGLDIGRYRLFKDGKWAEIIEEPNLNGKTAIIDGVEYELKLK